MREVQRLRLGVTEGEEKQSNRKNNSEKTTFVKRANLVRLTPRL
jgi:hypothetical protein